MTMNWWTLPALVAAAPLAYVSGRVIYDDVYQRVRVWQDDRIELHARKAAATVDAVRHLPPDENGRLGIAVTPSGRFVNLDTRAVFDEWRVHHIEPLVERLNHMEKLLLSARGIHGDTQSLLDAPDVAFQWPVSYEWETMAKRYLKRPSLHNILLGVTYDETGAETPVIADMEDLIHVMIGGRSGFGKSNLEYVIAKQLIESADPCKLALIDYAGVTLKPLEQSDRVLWPTATDDDSAMPVLLGLVQELERRKQLYADCPGVQKLSQYNALDREPLEPWFLFLDETSQVLRNTRLAGMLTVISEQARKFGLGIIGAGTTWHAREAPEPFRVNFATRLAMYCSSSTSRVVLDGDPSASDLERPGQACAMLPGQTGIQRILTPVVEFEVLGGEGPLYDMPSAPDDDGSASQVERIFELHEQGKSLRYIEKEVYGYAGGAAHDKVTGILGATTTEGA